MRRLFLFVVLTIFVNACSTRYVPVESVRVDSVRVETVRRDSVVLRDSVYVVQRGDTVFKTKYKYVYRDRVLRDTFYHVKCDTITRVVEVEKRLSRSERLKMDVGGGVLWALPIIIGLFLLYRRLKK